MRGGEGEVRSVRRVRRVRRVREEGKMEEGKIEEMRDLTGERG